MKIYLLLEEIHSTEKDFNAYPYMSEESAIKAMNSKFNELKCDMGIIIDNKNWFELNTQNCLCAYNKADTECIILSVECKEVKQ